MAECDGWRPPSPHAAVRVRCVSHNFGVGLVASLPVIADSDVMVTPHGADMVNAFALHRGSSHQRARGDARPPGGLPVPDVQGAPLLRGRRPSRRAALPAENKEQEHGGGRRGQGWLRVGYNMDLRLPSALSSPSTPSSAPALAAAGTAGPAAAAPEASAACWTVESASMNSPSSMGRSRWE